MNYKVEILDQIEVLGRGTILVVNKDNYHLNDIINDEYIISAIEYSQYSSKMGLVVRKINFEDIRDGNQ